MLSQKRDGVIVRRQEGAKRRGYKGTTCLSYHSSLKENTHELYAL